MMASLMKVIMWGTVMERRRHQSQAGRSSSFSWKTSSLSHLPASTHLVTSLSLSCDTMRRVDPRLKKRAPEENKKSKKPPEALPSNFVSHLEGRILTSGLFFISAAD